MAFARVFAELSRMRVREIQVAADGVLRYLPFAALHDGRGYLVERFAFIAKVDTPVQPTQPIASRLNANNGIAFFAASHTREARQGSTEAPLPNALPEVVRSSDVMRAAKVPSHVFKEFSSADFTKTMRSDLVPSVVHVASHFILNPASETESTLLTSDGALSLATMANWSWRGVKLAVFSACNTGLGGQSAGLHETLLRAGAENVVASLWMVNDSSAAQFMPAMYKSWTGKQDWQRAFAQTQRHFARGGAGKTLSHPHHWAAFVLYSAGA
jgi:CHAT domain-containing protein